MRFNSNRGKVILGLLEAYIATKQVLRLEELIPLLPLTPKQIADAYGRTAKEFLLKSRNLTVRDGKFQDLDKGKDYEQAPYKGRSLKEVLELLIAEAKKNDVKLPKVLKKQWIKKVDTTLNNDIDSRNEEYLPTREDFESAYKMLAHTGVEISVEKILDQIEVNTKDAGRQLKSNWRKITEKNIFDVWPKTKWN